MPNKFHRQNFRMGTNPFSRKSNIQKIAEVFGPKKTKVKKDKKPKKRMMANKGGGADTGTMGEIKSKVTVAADKMKRMLKNINPKKLTKEDIKNLSLDDVRNFKGTISDRELQFLTDMMPKIKRTENSKGGPAKKKFPDISGDGKVTMKDVLMARGVIPKNKKDKKKVI